MIDLVLGPLPLMLISGLVVIGLITLLIIMLLWPRGWSSGGFGVCGAIAANRHRLQSGISSIKLNRRLIKVLQEGLGAIRDVLLDSTKIFIKMRMSKRIGNGNAGADSISVLIEVGA